MAMTDCLLQFMRNTCQPWNQDLMAIQWLSAQATSSVPHFAVFTATNGLFTRGCLLLISCHDNKLFLFTELGNIVVVIVHTPCSYCHGFTSSVM